jgi:hypothetical protein
MGALDALMQPGSARLKRPRSSSGPAAGTQLGLTRAFGFGQCGHLARPGEAGIDRLLNFATASTAGEAGEANQRIAAKSRFTGHDTVVVAIALLVSKHIENIVIVAALLNVPMFSTFPDNALWNAERQAVEFGVEIGEYAVWCAYHGACFSVDCRTHPRLNVVSKHTICSEHFLRGSPSESCGGVS